MSENILEKSIGKSGMIVMTLFESYLRKSRTPVTNNWYSSPNLFMELYTNLTNAYRTVRKNRLNIPELNKKLDTRRICISFNKQFIDAEMNRQKRSMGDFHISLS